MGVTQTLDITTAQRKVILTLLKRFLPNTTVWVYGSRVKWTARPQSDLDMAVFTTPKQKPQFENLKEAFEESDLPFRVDLFVWDDVPEQFHKNIEAEHVVLQEKVEKAIPMGWEISPIKEVALVNELSIKVKTAPKNIEYIDIASVEKGQVNETQSLVFDKAPSRARRIVRDNDSLIATVRPNLEHYTFIKKARQNLIASTGFAVVSAKKVNPRFLYYYLTSKPFTAYLTRIAESHTSAYPAFNPDVIENADALVPSPPEQDVIAHILGSLDDKIELNRKMNETLEAMARAIFKSWFVDFDPVRAKMEGRKPHGMDSQTAALFPDSFIDSELGKIPKGWGVSEIRERAANIQYGLTRSASKENNGKKFLRITDIQCGEVDWSNVPFVQVNEAEFDKYKLIEGDIVVARTGASTGENTFVVDPPESVFASYLVRLQFDKKGISRLVGAFMRTHDYFDFVAEVIGGSAQPNASAQILAAIKMIFPPLNLAEVFYDSVNPLDKLKAKLKKQSQTLSAIRDTLLPKLLSGELRIPEAEKLVEAMV